jgi:hypothetical protein
VLLPAAYLQSPLVFLISSPCINCSDLREEIGQVDVVDSLWLKDEWGLTGLRSRGKMPAYFHDKIVAAIKKSTLLEPKKKAALLEAIGEKFDPTEPLS